MILTHNDGRSGIIFLIILFFISNFTVWAENKEIVKVACIGNSITFGSGINDKPRDAYPAQLARMLGGNYYVRNYGFSGRTMLQNGDYPFMKEKQTVFQCYCLES